MKLFKSITILSIFSMLFLFSCSDSTTNTDDNDNMDIPDDAIAFPNAQAAAEFAVSTLSGVGDFVVGSLYVFDDNSAKRLGKVTGDSLYYRDGWWYYSASTYYNDGESGFGLSMELNNKYQFSKNGSVQQDWDTADKVHAIVDAEGSFSMEATTMDMKYYFDINYSNINSMVLPVMVDGNGYYDITYDSEETGKQRYYITYTFDNLKIPEEDYPAGSLTVGTKNFDVVMVFNSTNMVTVSVMQDGKTVYSMQYNLDSEDENV